MNMMSRERWELLYDPTPSRVMKGTRQQSDQAAEQTFAARTVVEVVSLDHGDETTAGIYNFV